MSEMVDRVARALFADVVTGIPMADWNSEDTDIHEHYRRMARVGIEAMREPTGLMVDAALANDKQWSINAIPRLRTAWRAMIDAALAKETKP